MRLFHRLISSVRSRLSAIFPHLHVYFDYFLLEYTRSCHACHTATVSLIPVFTCLAVYDLSQHFRIANTRINTSVTDLIVSKHSRYENFIYGQNNSLDYLKLNLFLQPTVTSGLWRVDFSKTIQLQHVGNNRIDTLSLSVIKVQTSWMLS